MDKAKAAVSGFISKAGHHDTTVHERVDAAVEHQTINPHQREERQIATDLERHQDHYHTTVQPVHDREVLAEQHHHNIVPIEHRTHDNRDTTDTDTKLRTAKAQFKNEQVRTETQHTAQALPTVTGEHTHHHIHETIQPVVHKEIIEPHVMHTTVPVHEVHHEKAQHHAASALPAMTMDQFKKGGGALVGREERVDHFKGEPKNIEQSLAGGSGGLRDSGLGSSGTSSGLGHSSHTGHHGTGTAAGVAGGALASDRHTGTHGHTAGQGLGNTTQTGSGLTGSHGTSGNPTMRDTSGSGLTGSKNTTGELGEFSHRHDGNHPTGVHQSSTTGTGSTGSGLGSSTSHSSTGSKPSLMDRLNPKKDADGDGKAGWFS